MPNDIHVILRMPKADIAEFLAQGQELMAQGEVFADSCIAILVVEHGANPLQVRRDIFSERYVGRRLLGRPDMTPHDMVAEALRDLKPQYLGLPTDYAAPRLLDIDSPAAQNLTLDASEIGF
jgi:hypothetical protein